VTIQKRKFAYYEIYFILTFFILYILRLCKIIQLKY